VSSIVVYYAAVLIGHIMDLAHPSVCLTVSLFVSQFVRAPNSKTNWQRKI